MKFSFAAVDALLGVLKPGSARAICRVEKSNHSYSCGLEDYHNISLEYLVGEVHLFVYLLLLCSQLLSSQLDEESQMKRYNRVKL